MKMLKLLAKSVIIALMILIAALDLVILVENSLQLSDKSQSWIFYFYAGSCYVFRYVSLGMFLVDGFTKELEFGEFVVTMVVVEVTICISSLITVSNILCYLQISCGFVLFMISLALFYFSKINKQGSYDVQMNNNEVNQVDNQNQNVFNGALFNNRQLAPSGDRLISFVMI